MGFRKCRAKENTVMMVMTPNAESVEAVRATISRIFRCSSVMATLALTSIISAIRAQLDCFLFVVGWRLWSARPKRPLRMSDGDMSQRLFSVYIWVVMDGAHNFGGTLRASRPMDGT